jgi:hypothetical protein
MFPKRPKTGPSPCQKLKKNVKLAYPNQSKLTSHLQMSFPVYQGSFPDEQKGFPVDSESFPIDPVMPISNNIWKITRGNVKK